MRRRFYVALVLSRVALAQLRDWWREVRHWQRVRN